METKYTYTQKTSRIMKNATKLLKIDPRDYEVSKELLDLVNKKISLCMALKRKNVSEEEKRRIEKELK